MAGQIIRRGERKWLVRWYIGRAGGKRRYASRTIHGTKKQASCALREILAKQDRGFVVPSPSTMPTLREYVERWRAGEVAASLRARTLRDYLANLERHVYPRLGDARLNAIHTARIETDVVAPLRAKGHLRTARLAVSALSRVFRSATKDPTLGLIGNPCTGVEIGRKPRRELCPLNPQERGRFRDAIRGTEHEDLWLLMMLTGLGPGEALALGWEHLDLEAGALRVARTLDCKARQLVEDTKRPSRKRAVPLVPELRTALQERWMRAGRPPAGLVFSTASGEPLDLDNMRARHFQDALKRAEISRPIRIYDLRHGFATAALEAGTDTRTVADLMGHSSTRTTQDVYQHVSDERKREAAERIGQVLSPG
jgi:integrase